MALRLRAHILGTGRYLPARRVSNHEIAARVATSDAWIQERLGIKERRFAADDEHTSDLAALAAERALSTAGVAPTDLDAIVVALGSGDVTSPATACYVQEKLGATRALAFDVRAACAGFVVGLDVARAFVESGAREHVLVVGAGIVSRTEIDWRDRTSPALFGDGAGAAVVGRSRDEQSGFVSSFLCSDGSAKDAVGVYGGGSRAPFTPSSLERGEDKITMDGKAVWRHAVRRLPEAVRAVLAQADLGVDDVDLLVTHQGNLRLLETIGVELGIEAERTHTTVERYGNTLAASVAVTLDEAVELGKVARGDVVVIAAIGAGMTWGAHLLRW